jgi:ppGpp synthetase/RelA/SpoT-type nucleotidyltranferase
MANMSYCRFENTYHDLVDCFDNIWSEAENERDERYRRRMIELLKERIDEIEDLAEELRNR